MYDYKFIEHCLDFSWREQESKLHLNDMMMMMMMMMMIMSGLFYTYALSCTFIVLDHWNNSPLVDVKLHSDTLSWFRVNQSLLLLLNAACFV